MSEPVSQARVGIVIPTLGTRLDYLRKAITSIRNASEGDVYILLVAPASCSEVTALEVDQVVIDSGKGLASAINAGIRELPESIEFVNWLGDDDLLEPSAIDTARRALENSTSPFVFGQCKYIDSGDRLLFVNRSGKWATQLMRFGPQLIPQPGALLRRSAFETIGGLDTHFKWAFDLDMFIKMSKLGRPTFLPTVLASFRWHDDSLSVGGRKGSVLEASQVRKRHLPRIVRLLSFVWEPLMRQVIFRIGQNIKTSKES